MGAREKERECVGGRGKREREGAGEKGDLGFRLPGGSGPSPAVMNEEHRPIPRVGNPGPEP